ncbi:MAG TPA: S41 family peptidase [Ramlibacter sp.]|uniref:S41 family peptidase n=1 Tax=Ramlibacter sp. TaxID=1917967 RepID=UPI002ED005CF
MGRLPSTLRASAAAWVLLAATAASASTAASTDDPVTDLQAAYARALPPGERADFYKELFATVLQRVQRSYATEVDLHKLAAAARQSIEQPRAGEAEPAEVFGQAMNAALRTLDNYSRYLDPRARGDDRDSMSGNFGGLGLEVEAGEGAVRVVAPVPDGPAWKAGVQSGDLIVRVDDQPLAGVPLADAIARMRGHPGTPVTLTLRRGARSQEFTVALTRDIIRRQVLRWNMEGDVLVLRLGVFSGAVSAALQRAIEEATATQAPRAVVLDLRGNPGGLLREAVLTADTFLSQGAIVSLHGRTPSNQRSWQADAAELLPGVPMVVLIDRRSASASELVAAALQENGRAVVMGQRSFGKGTVQTTFSLGEETKGALKLTTSYYHAPSGRAVQTTGVTPDVELLAPTAAAVAAAASEQAPRARVEQARCGATIKAPDPALACAVAYLEAGSIDRFVSLLGAPAP